jgi:hypothetical protein
MRSERVKMKNSVKKEVWKMNGIDDISTPCVRNCVYSEIFLSPDQVLSLF